MLLLHHAFHLYRVTWWQIGLNSKEDICVTLCHLLVEAGRAGLSQTPSTAITVVSSTCGTSVLTDTRRSFGSERVQQKMVATVTQGACRLCHFIKGYH